MNETKQNEFDKFMMSLENAGIIKGFSKFIIRAKPDSNENSQSE